MPIKVSSPTPTKKFLPSDPDGGSWVMIKPTTYRDELVRGEVLKEREVSSNGMVSKGINIYRLHAEELWLTYADAHIVTSEEDGEPVCVPFKPREEMERGDFMDVLTGLPSAIVLEWHRLMTEVNPDWAYPF